MPKVMITPEALRESNGPEVEVLQNAGFEVVYPQDPYFARGNGGEQQTVAELTGFDAVIASGEQYTEAVLQQLPGLRVIARCGVGYDRVDVPAATRHRIPLTITPNSNHEAVAEMTISLLMAVTKFTILNDQNVRGGQWSRRLPRPLRGNTFGLLGLGRIGRSTAIRARAFSMRLIAHERFPDMDFVNRHEIELVDLDTLLAEADFLSIHCPLNDETQGMFCAELFHKMKRGAVLLNTARGKLVVESDLVEALDSGQLSGAGLDVFDPEPPAVDNPLLKMDNVVCSPHVGGTDQLSMVAMGVESAECIVKLHQGGWPDGAVVNQEIQEGWSW
ncbi:MAG: D-3-phosphoglycerate dehydrogenase [Pirellulaceae bacterium]|jgi:D-3-phosphoglycerate dehydrogenase